MKICNKCKVEKELNQFSKDKSKKDGLMLYCKVCSKAHSIAWQKANPEKAKAQVAAWQKANPEKVSEKNRRWAKSIEPGIYMVRNQITGLSYIGQSKTPLRRRGEHMSIRKSKKGFNTNLWLQVDLKKYGREAFIFGIIEHCAKEELEAKEQFWINKLNPEYNK